MLMRTDREPGQKIKLHSYIVMHTAKLREEWNSLPIEEIRALEDELKKTRKEKDQRAITRAAPKAILANVNATFQAMDQEACSSSHLATQHD
jgi:hypothetical protein